MFYTPSADRSPADCDGLSLHGRSVEPSEVGLVAVKCGERRYHPFAEGVDGA